MISYRQSDLLENFKNKGNHFVEYGFRCGPHGCQIYFKGIPDIRAVNDDKTLNLEVSLKFKEFLKALGWGVATHIEASSPYKNLLAPYNNPLRYLDLTLNRFLRISYNTESEKPKPTSAEGGIFYFEL